MLTKPPFGQSRSMPVTDTAQSASEARLGIFWLLTDGAGSTLVANSVPLGAAEP